MTINIPTYIVQNYNFSSRDTTCQNIFKNTTKSFLITDFKIYTCHAWISLHGLCSNVVNILLWELNKHFNIHQRYVRSLYQHRDCKLIANITLNLFYTHQWSRKSKQTTISLFIIWGTWRKQSKSLLTQVYKQIHIYHK